ncbi:zinc transporter ZIP1-like [Xenia sp. Carnegie-2017]|uniref:zinc transporter ZIP1-like n=1 Tax=Xenia sp. Carnegie-2017 TaxID=2897299 RepID=UPI001F03BAC4|nr:zinc transporter ZIP1-like [Xenia sp. Carnegie-2017]
MEHTLAVKIISLCALFLVTFAAGLLPLFLRDKKDVERTPSDLTRRSKRNQRRKQLLSLGMCFAGGAFFASSMLELLPTVDDDFKYILKGKNSKYPLAEFGVSVGFFIVLFIEQIVHATQEGQESREHSHLYVPNSKTPLLRNGDRKSARPGSSTMLENGESDDNIHAMAENLGQLNGDNTQNDLAEIDDEPDPLLANLQKKHHNFRHYLSTYILFIALSVHALFEGLAIGLFHKVDKMIGVLGPVIVHKCLLAFSLGVNMVQQDFRPLAIARSSFVFSALSPTGFGIGILLVNYESSSTTGHVLSAVFQAIATGTFFYVTFFEILFHELNSKDCHRLVKLFSLVLGYGVVAIVEFFKSDI